jgi:hypothetical protein
MSFVDAIKDFLNTSVPQYVWYDVKANKIEVYFTSEHDFLIVNFTDDSMIYLGEL